MACYCDCKTARGGSGRWSCDRRLGHRLTFATLGVTSPAILLPSCSCSLPLDQRSSSVLFQPSRVSNYVLLHSCAGFVAPDRCTMSCHPFQGPMTTQLPIWLHSNAQQRHHAYFITASNILLHPKSLFLFFLVQIAVLYRVLRQYLASGATPSSPLRSPHFDSATTRSPTTSASCAQPRQTASSNFIYLNQSLLNLREC